MKLQIGYDDFGKVTRTFSLKDSEVDYIESAVLNFYVPNQAPQKITIHLNKELVYSAQPTGQTALQISPYSLVAGTNEIEFTTERGGEYDIYFIALVTGVAPFATAPIRATYFFDVSDDDWLKAQNNYYRCTMQLKRVGGSSSVRVKLNSHEKTYFFVDNLIREDVCKYLVRGKNTIRLTSPISLDLAELSIKITT